MQTQPITHPRRVAADHPPRQIPPLAHRFHALQPLHPRFLRKNPTAQQSRNRNKHVKLNSAQSAAHHRQAFRAPRPDGRAGQSSLGCLMRSVKVSLVSVALILHCLAFARLGGLVVWGGVAFALPFVFTPLAVCAWLAIVWSSPRARPNGEDQLAVTRYQRMPVIGAVPRVAERSGCRGGPGLRCGVASFRCRRPAVAHQ